MRVETKHFTSLLKDSQDNKDKESLLQIFEENNTVYPQKIVHQMLKKTEVEVKQNKDRFGLGWIRLWLLLFLLNW